MLHLRSNIKNNKIDVISKDQQENIILKYSLKSYRFKYKLNCGYNPICLNNQILVYGYNYLKFTVFHNKLAKYCRKLNQKSLIKKIICSKINPNIFYIQGYNWDFIFWNLNNKFYREQSFGTNFILSYDEQQIISTKNKDITVWKFGKQKNSHILTHYQSLQSIHNQDIQYVILNNSMDTLVSIDKTNVIVIWKKDLKFKWTVYQIIEPEQQKENNYKLGQFINNQLFMISFDFYKIISFQDIDGKYQKINTTQLNSIIHQNGSNMFNDSMHLFKSNLLLYVRLPYVFILTIDNQGSLIQNTLIFAENLCNCYVAEDQNRLIIVNIIQNYTYFYFINIDIQLNEK